LRLFFIRNYQSTKAPDNGSNLIDEKFFERSFRLKTIPKSIYLEMICELLWEKVRVRRNLLRRADE
jgi:hypothetical protein